MQTKRETYELITKQKPMCLIVSLLREIVPIHASPLGSPQFPAPDGHSGTKWDNPGRTGFGRGR